MQVAVYDAEAEKPPRRDKIQRVDRPGHIQIDTQCIKKHRKFEQVLEVVRA